MMRKDVLTDISVPTLLVTARHDTFILMALSLETKIADSSCTSSKRARTPHRSSGPPK